MIFDCPRCEAENAVPVSDIPEQGKVVTCAGCRQPFRVLPPEEDDFDEDETRNAELGEDNAEKTALSMSPMISEAPLPDEDPTAGIELPLGGDGPAPQLAVERDNTDAGPLLAGERSNASRRGANILDQETGRIPHDGLNGPPPAKTAPVIQRPETRPVSEGAFAETLMPDQLKGLGRRGRPREPRSSPGGGSGLTTPSASSPEARALAEPIGGGAGSSQAQVAVQPIPNVLELVRRTPLAVKVALVVFPISLLIFAIVDPIGAGDDVEPIALPVENEAAAIAPEGAPVAVEETAPVEGAAVTPPLAAKAAIPAGKGIALDTPAKTGWAYVIADDVRMRTMVGEAGQVVVKLRSGELVRRVENLGSSTLILSGPNGPAGFVSSAALSEQMPIAALAEQHAFKSCSAAQPEDIEPCSAAAKEQRDACHSGCATGPAPEGATDAEGLRVRCKQACDLAYAKCERGCTPKAKPAPPPQAAAVKQKPKPRPPVSRPKPLQF